MWSIDLVNSRTLSYNCTIQRRGMTWGRSKRAIGIFGNLLISSRVLGFVLHNIIFMLRLQRKLHIMFYKFSMYTLLLT